MPAKKDKLDEDSLKGLGRVITIVLDDDDEPYVYIDGITRWAVPGILQAVLDDMQGWSPTVNFVRPDMPLADAEDDEDG